MMCFDCYFPFWNSLSEAQRTSLAHAAGEKRFAKGDTVHSGAGECIGLLIVKSGLLRVFIMTEEGKELTLYRLGEGDVCLLSASCVLNHIQFEVYVAAEQDTEVLHIPSESYKKLMRESLPVSEFTNQLMADRFSEVMWLMDQILSKKLDSRLAALLLEERRLAGGRELRVTHEQLGNHLGSPREVVTRMLKHFQDDGLVSLGRGSIRLEDTAALRLLAEERAR